jgi:hypothetical protein
MESKKSKISIPFLPVWVAVIVEGVPENGKWVELPTGIIVGLMNIPLDDGALVVCVCSQKDFLATDPNQVPRLL